MAEVVDEEQVVVDDEACFSVEGHHIPDDFGSDEALFYVEVGGRFVEEVEVCFLGERCGQVDALELSPAEFVEVFVEEGCEPEGVDQLVFEVC